jgi:lathosterol oxidase
MLAAFLSAMVMTLIVGVRYLITSGFFGWLTGRVRPGLYDRLRPQMRREIYWSLVSAAIYGIPAGLVAWGWGQSGLDPDLPRHIRLSALVSAAIGAALSRGA